MNNFILILLAYTVFSCQPSDRHPVSPEAGAPSPFTYDLAKPQRQWTLPPALDEISGNFWLDSTHHLVIEDLRPSLYVISLGEKAVIEKEIIYKKDTAKKFDIEDITAIGNTAYALRSHGVIYKIENWRATTKFTKIETFLSKENNPEGLCYDPVSGNLLIACKGVSGMESEKKSARVVYMFDTRVDTLIATPFMVIRRSKLREMGGADMEFNPSAIAVHPVTHEIYILSTRGSKCLARFSREGELLSIQFIDANLMPQPEGMCFSPSGTLYISSEGKDSRGKICEFVPAKKG